MSDGTRRTLPGAAPQAAGARRGRVPGFAGHSGEPHDEAPHHPKLQHHFDDMEQQAEASTLGMWVFLVTEIMFFGGLFTRVPGLPVGRIRQGSRRPATT